MMTQFTQAAQRLERRRLSSLVGPLLLATGIIAILQPVSLVAAAECLVKKDNERIHGIPSWEGIAPPIQASSITMAWNCFCGLTPYMDSSRFLLGKTDNPGMAAITACLNQNTGKTAPLDQATLSPIGKTTSQMQPLRASRLPYNGKRQVVKIRTTPPVIKLSAGYTPSTIIGPVQEIHKPILSDERSVTRAIALAPPIDKAPSLFGDYPLGPLNLFQSNRRLPDTKSHRMNLTTTQALHGRDCVSDCP